MCGFILFSEAANSSSRTVRDYSCCVLGFHQLSTEPDAKNVYHKYLLTCGITCNGQPETQVSYIWQERAVLLHCR